MTTHADMPAPNDPGLTALVMLLRFHGIGADPAQIRHQCGTVTIGIAEMLRCAKEFGLKARELKMTWESLATTAVAGHRCAARTAAFCCSGRLVEDKIVVQSTKTPRPELMTQGRSRGASGTAASS